MWRKWTPQRPCWLTLSGLSLIILTDLFPSLASGFQEVLSTLSSAPHYIHQQQPQFPMCQDDAVSAAMMPALPSSVSSDVLHYCVACVAVSYACFHCTLILCSPWQLPRCLISSALQPLLPLFLSLSPHKDLLARCCCRLEALEPDRGEASCTRSYNEGAWMCWGDKVGK